LPGFLALFYCRYTFLIREWYKLNIHWNIILMLYTFYFIYQVKLHVKRWKYDLSILLLLVIKTQRSRTWGSVNHNLLLLETISVGGNRDNSYLLGNHRLSPQATSTCTKYNRRKPLPPGQSINTEYLLIPPINNCFVLLLTFLLYGLTITDFTFSLICVNDLILLTFNFAWIICIKILLDIKLLL